MKYLFLMLCCFLSYVSLAQKSEPRKELKAGNKAYQQKKFDSAAKQYEKAIEKQPKSYKGNFNLGDALYQNKEYDKARTAFNQSVELATNKQEKADALHNVGNTFMAQKKWEDAVNTYKHSLKLDAQNKNTIYNLAYAQEMLKKDQNNKDKNKNKKNQDKKDQDKKNQDKENQDKKDQDKKDQDKKNQDKKDQDKKDQERPQPQPSKLTKQEAANILNALQQEEKKLHQGEKDTQKGAPAQLEKDW